MCVCCVCVTGSYSNEAKNFLCSGFFLPNFIIKRSWIFRFESAFVVPCMNGQQSEQQLCNGVFFFVRYCDLLINSYAWLSRSWSNSALNSVINVLLDLWAGFHHETALENQISPILKIKRNSLQFWCSADHRLRMSASHWNAKLIEVQYQMSQWHWNEAKQPLTVGVDQRQLRGWI